MFYSRDELIYHLFNTVLRDNALTSEVKITAIKTAYEQCRFLRLEVATGYYWYREPRHDGTTELAVDTGGRCGWTLLMVAARDGDLSLVQWLIEQQGATINLANDSGFTAVAAASEKDSTDVMQYLIAKGANIDLATTDDADDTTVGLRCEGSTPLHQAVRYGRIAAALCLLKNGATLKANNDGETAIDLAHHLIRLQTLTPIELSEDNELRQDFFSRLGKDGTKTPAISTLKKMVWELERHYLYKFQAYSACCVAEKEASLVTALQIKKANDFMVLVLAMQKIVRDMHSTKLIIPVEIEWEIIKYLCSTRSEEVTMTARARHLLEIRDVNLTAQGRAQLLNQHLFCQQVPAQSIMKAIGPHWHSRLIPTPLAVTSILGEACSVSNLLG